MGRSAQGRVGSFAVAVLAGLGTFAAAPSAQAGVAALDARGSAEQVQVTGATPGATVKLLRDGAVVASRPGGELGGVVFRHVAPGRRYTVRSQGTVTAPVRVFSNRGKPLSTAGYDQSIGDGYGYLTTRDGTKLAINVHLPGPVGDGPYPTLIEYSGYAYAQPGSPQSGIQPVAQALGYAVVDVNMRGTGCSGGAFDFFEPLQSLDGYDVIETIARQPWVAHGKVGMLGISYGGISQLFVAAKRPPHLAAITPLSVIDSTMTTLYPGGILNTGFALEWGQDRVDDAEPAGPDSGQPWAWERIEDGDATCAANQDLHPEATNLIKKIRRNRYYRPKVADPLSPVTFVDRIDVPVFAACQWTDEQTGGHCPTLAGAMTGTKKKWFTFTNGVHVDALDPETFNRWYDFLQIYVAREKPELSPTVKALAPVLFKAFTGVPGVTLPDDPIQDEPDLASARAAFEAQPPIRVLFDNGAGGAPVKPIPGFERSFDRFPPRGTKPRSWFMAGRGRLVDAPGGGADRFEWNPAARPPTDFSGDTGSGDLWTDHPSYEWTPNPEGTALAYVSAPLKRDTTVLGSGEVQVWVRSKARNVDLQATVTEVRPDGKETFVQGGWLRTEARKVDRRASTLGDPRPTFRRRDAETLPRGRWVKVRIPLYYEGHVYREGSRLRVIVSAPGGDQPTWAFAETAADPPGTPWVAVAHSRKHPSRLVLPVTPKLGAPTPLPACPALRGQPCRDYERLANERFDGG